MASSLFSKSKAKNKLNTNRDFFCNIFEHEDYKKILEYVKCLTLSELRMMNLNIQFEKRKIDLEVKLESSDGIDLDISRIKKNLL